jgi:hypothetical protein
MMNINANDFPTLDGVRSYRWMPILLQPIVDSPEQFVIAVAAFGQNEFHLANANALQKLSCLYGKQAEWSRLAVEETLAELLNDISKRGEKAITEPELLFSGFSIGRVGHGDGLSARQVAEFWIDSISSLHDKNESESLISVMFKVDTSALPSEQRRSDQLPTMVLDYVKSFHPELSSFFSEEVHKRKAGKNRLRAHEVEIDYTGNKLVANFGLLKANQTRPSFNVLKRRMWDLKIHRDTKEGKLGARNHELFIKCPRNDEPDITERQIESINRAVDSLMKEADIEQIRLRSFHSVNEIGNELLQLEKVN